MKHTMFAGWLILREMPYDRWDENGSHHATGYARVCVTFDEGCVYVDTEPTYEREYGVAPFIDIPAEGETVFTEDEFRKIFYGETEDEDDPD